MASTKPSFRKLKLETPTAEQVHSEKKTKYNRYAYEWYMENTVETYFNLTQELAEHTYTYTKSMIKKTAILAGTSTAVAIVALVAAVISFRKEH